MLPTSIFFWAPGGLVKKDEAYVELEAMKMIMPLKVGVGDDLGRQV